MIAPRLRTIAFTSTLLLLLSVALTTTPASAAASGRLGVFRGSGVPTEVANYESWLGQPVATVIDFTGRAALTDTTPWGAIDNPSWICRQWKSRTSRLVLSAAMLPNTNFTLAAGAKGDYNAHWKSFGETLVANGCASTTIRIGWEFNGNFFAWAAGGKESFYVAYWRQIVNTLRKVPNQHFLFNWCPLAGATKANVEAAWPGADYVDVIGLDAYDTNQTQNVTDPAKRWNNQLTRTYGLNWLDTFAKSKTKPMSFPEWGITLRPNDGLGGGDNPNYITKMWQWIHTHNVLYTAYFEVNANDAAHRLMPIDGTLQFPKASAEYKRLVKAGV